MPRQRESLPPAAAVAVADRLHSAAIHLLRRLRAEDSEAGLSAPKLSALSVVVFGGPVTLGDLAAAEQVKPPTITRLVADLERDGLVRRAADATDGRITRVEATARGRKILEEGRARRVRRLAAELAALPEDERKTLERAAAVLEALSRKRSERRGC